MPYPFVNFGGVPLPKEWVDCGYSSKPSQIASYGSNVRTAINMSADDLNNPNISHRLNFAGATPLDSWSMEITLALSGSQEGKITLFRCKNEAEFNGDSFLIFDRGRVTFQHGTGANSRKNILTKQLDQSGPSRIFTLNIACNEQTGDVRLWVDGEREDENVSSSTNYANQVIGTAPSYMLLGNTDSANHDPHRMNVLLYDFKFSGNDFRGANGNINVATGIYTPVPWTVSTNPSSFTISGEKVEVQPSAEVIKYTSPSIHNFTKFNNKAIVFTTPHASKHGIEQGKVSFTFSGNSLREYKYLEEATRTAVRANLSISTGYWRLTGHSTQANSAVLGDSPTGGIDIQTITIPSANNGLTINHNLGRPPIAAMLIDDTGHKFFATKKSDIMHSVMENYDGAEFTKQYFSPFCFRTATASTIRFAGKNDLLISSDRKTGELLSPRIVETFVDDAGRSFVVFATSVGHWDDTIHLGKTADFKTYEVTNTGMVLRHSMTDSTILPRAKHVSILKDKSTNKIYMHVFVKATGWRQNAKGYTSMYAFRWESSSKSWTMLESHVNVDNTDWLSPTTSTADADARQLVAWKSVDIDRSSTTERIIGIAVFSDNPPGGSQSGGGDDGGGGWTPDPPGADDPFRPDQIDNRISNTDVSLESSYSNRADKAFGPSGLGDSRPVRLWMAVYGVLGLSTIPIPGGYAGGYNSHMIDEYELLHGEKTYLAREPEISVYPIEGTGKHLVNIGVVGGGAQSEVQSFLMDSDGSILRAGQSGFNGSSISLGWNYQGVGLVVNGNETYLFESSVGKSGTSTGHGAVTASRLVVEDTSKATTYVRKEAMASFPSTVPVGFIDAVQYKNETYIVVGSATLGGAMNMHVMKYDYTKHSFDYLHSIGGWPYLKVTGSSGKANIGSFYKPKFIVNGDKFYIATSFVSHNGADHTEERLGMVFEWNETTNSFVNSWLMDQMSHRVSQGTAKLVLFAEGASVSIDDDLPFRSSVIRASYQFELGVVDAPWGNGIPKCALSDYMLDESAGLTSSIFHPDLNQKEMVAFQNMNTGVRCFRTITVDDRVAAGCYDYFHKKVVFGMYGHFNNQEDGSGVPMWFNENASYRNKTFPAGTQVEMFLTGDDTAAVAVSNYSGTNGRVAISPMSVFAMMPTAFTELPGKSGKVIGMRRMENARISTNRDNFVAICFQNKTDGAQIHIAGVDAKLDGGFSTSQTGWTVFGGFAHNGSATTAFDICSTSNSTRATCAAAVDSNGNLYYWVDQSMTQASAKAPTGIVSRGNHGVVRWGGNFDKARDVKLFSANGDTWMYVFCERGIETANHVCGHVVQYKLNNTSLDFEYQGHIPEMHYSKMADRPFEWNGEWYWYGGIASKEVEDYPFAYTTSEQSMCLFKFIPEKGSFTTSPVWSGVEYPLVLGIPRYNTTSEFRHQAHPIVCSYAAGKMTYGLLNSPDLVIDNTRDKGFYYRPSRYNVEYFGGVPQMVPDLDGATGANSSYGAGGNDMVLKISAGTGYANPFIGFNVDYRWEQSEHPFVENWKTHYYPTVTGFTADATGREDEAAVLTAGNTKFRMDALIQKNTPGCVVTPSIIPGKNRKTSGKLYMEVGFEDCDMTPTEIADGAFILEGANEGELFGQIRNTSAWNPAGGLTLTGTFPVTSTRQDFVAGLLFDYGSNKVSTYVNGTLRSTYTIPDYDMRIRGVLRKAYGPLQNSGLYINFGQVPFKHSMPSGSQTFSGATLGGTYGQNYLSSFHLGKNVVSTNSSSTVDVTMFNDADVVFLLASGSANGGSCVVIKEEGYENTFDLDGIGGKITRSGPVITDLSNKYRVNNNRWSSGSFELLTIGLSAKPCYGVYVHTYNGNGISGERELPVELPRTPGAALVLPHSAGDSAYWVFYNKFDDKHYYFKAGNKETHKHNGWAGGPLFLKGSYDGRATLNTIPSGTQPNFNKSGDKYTIVFFCDVPGILNIRQRSQSIVGIHEAQSFDTNVKAAIFTQSSENTSFDGPWQYWTTDIYGIDDPSESSAGSGIFRTEGSTRFLRARASGTPEFNGNLAPVRFSEGVMIHGGYNYQAYPSPADTRSDMKYFGIFFGDGPLIYSPSSKK